MCLTPLLYHAMEERGVAPVPVHPYYIFLNKDIILSIIIEFYIFIL